MSTTADETACCAFCGLPLASIAAKPAEDVYCCFGCRFAASVSQERGAAGQAGWTLTRLGLAIFCALNVMVFTMALWSPDVFHTAPAAIGSGEAQFFGLFRYLALLFSLPVLLLLGGPLVESAVGEVLRGRPSTDLLLTLGVAASFGYSLVSVWQGAGPIYFEVGCMVLVAVTLGRWLEATGKLKTTEALRSLQKLLPDQVRRVRADREELWPLCEVVSGDLIRVLPGERIPLDGRLKRGRASVDEQVMTGESAPQVKESGDAVLSGTLNLDGDLLIEATAAADAGALQRLVEALTQAALQKGAYQRLADRISAWFLPAVAGVACLVFVMHTVYRDFPSGLLSGLAVVLIACPCALGLATPLALWAALGRAARSQVLFQSGDALSRLASAQAICFDKTGTLTTGSPTVENVFLGPGESREQVLRPAALLAGTSNHSFSAAVRQYADGCATNEQPENVTSVAGRGIQGTATELSATVYLGSLRFMEESEQTLDANLESSSQQALTAARPLVCLAWGGRVRALFSIQEKMRPEAAATVEHCRRLGLSICVLTGDRAARAAEIGRLLGVEAQGELLPEDKLAALRKTRDERGPVIMVGDGINDAPALAAADVGVALGCGADVSRQSADVCLLGNNLSQLPWAIELARETNRLIRWNLLWAFGYNVLGIGLAAAGWLSPIAAALAMVVSSLLVVGNSLRLANFPASDSDGDVDNRVHSAVYKLPQSLPQTTTLQAQGSKA